MKKLLFLTVLGISLLGVQPIFAAQEGYSQTNSQNQYAPEAPPPEKQERPPAQLMGDYAWIPGNWIWDGKWIWNPGHWEKKPHPNAIWEPGHWFHSPQGWYWVPGRWVY